MKKFLLLATIATSVLGFTATAQTQVEKAPVSRADRQVDPVKVAEMRLKRFSTEVPNLTGEQMQSAQAIFIETEKRRPEYQAMPKERLLEMQKIENEKLFSILNPDQLKSYKELLDKREATQKAALDQRLKMRENDLKSAPANR